jgi:photosystem II stability/assembly factor-like uncharacterized protein
MWIIPVFLAVLWPLIAVAQDNPWTRAPGSEGVEVVDADILNMHPDTMYAIGEHSLSSVDGGNSWQVLPEAPVTDVGAIGIDPTDGRRLFVSHFGIGASSNDISFSSDGGSTWDRLFIGRSLPVPIVEFDPVDPTTIYVGVGPNVIHRSTDRGSTWETLLYGTMYEPAQLAIAPSDNSVLFLAGRSEIMKSSDRGLTWHQVNPGIPVTSGARVAIHPQNPDIVYVAVVSEGSGDGGIFRTTDGGSTWNMADEGLTWADKDVHVLAIRPDRPDELYAGTGADGGGMLFRSTNGGDSWTAFSAGLPTAGFVSSVMFDTSRSTVHIGVSSPLTDGGGMYRRSDGVTTVSLLKTRGEESMTLRNFPNPFNSSTVIRFRLNDADHVSLRVYDIAGREVAILANGRFEAGIHSVQFDVTARASGLYVAILQTRNDHQTLRMITIR